MAAEHHGMAVGCEETFGLEEAAGFLKMSPEALRRKAKGGLVPGFKPGKSWVFLKSDLVSHLRSGYACQRQASSSGCKEVTACHSFDVVKPGGYPIQPHQDSEYVALLKLQRNGKLSSTTTN